MTRTPNNVENIETLKNSSVKLLHGNEKVASDNYESLKKLGKPMATINAKHNNSTASKLPADDMGSLQPQLLIAKGAKVMLTRNLWTEAGLCNGSIGIVLHIIYKDDDKPPALPIAVIVQFEEGYIGPSFCNDLTNCVPVPPVLAISDTLGSAHE